MSWVKTIAHLTFINVLFRLLLKTVLTFSNNGSHSYAKRISLHGDQTRSFNKSYSRFAHTRCKILTEFRLKICRHKFHSSFFCGNFSIIILHSAHGSKYLTFRVIGLQKVLPIDESHFTGYILVSLEEIHYICSHCSTYNHAISQIPSLTIIENPSHSAP